MYFRTKDIAGWGLIHQNGSIGIVDFVHCKERAVGSLVNGNPKA